MKNLNIVEANRMRADLEGELSSQRRQTLGISLCKISFNPEAWGVAIHLLESDTRDYFLDKMPAESWENARFYDHKSHLIEDSQAA